MDAITQEQVASEQNQKEEVCQNSLIKNPIPIIYQNHSFDIMMKYIDLSCGGLIDEMLVSPDVPYCEFESLIMKIIDQLNFEMILKLELNEETDAKQKLMRSIFASLIDSEIEKIKSNKFVEVNENSVKKSKSRIYPLKNMKKSEKKSVVLRTFINKIEDPNKLIIEFLEKHMWDCLAGNNQFAAKELYVKIKELGHKIQYTVHTSQKINELISRGYYGILPLLHCMEPMTDINISDIFRMSTTTIAENYIFCDAATLNIVYDWLDRSMKCEKNTLIASVFHEICLNAPTNVIMIYYDRYKQYVDMFSPLIFCRDGGPNEFLINALFDNIIENKQNNDDSEEDDDDSKIFEDDDDDSKMFEDDDGSKIFEDDDMIEEVDEVNDGKIIVDDNKININSKDRVYTELEKEILKKIQILCMDILNVEQFMEKKQQYYNRKDRKVAMKGNKKVNECSCGITRNILMIMSKFFKHCLPYDPLLVRSLFHKIKHQNCIACEREKTGMRIEFAKLVYKWCPGLIDRDIIDQCRQIMNSQNDEEREVSDDNHYFEWATSCVRLSDAIMQEIIYENVQNEMIELCQLCMKQTTHYFKECDHPICKKCLMTQSGTMKKFNKCCVCDVYGKKKGSRVKAWSDDEEDEEEEEEPAAKKPAGKKPALKQVPMKKEKYSESDY